MVVHVLSMFQYKMAAWTFWYRGKWMKKVQKIDIISLSKISMRGKDLRFEKKFKAFIQ